MEVAPEDRHVEEPRVLSPSGIETWNSCERKGAFIYIAGIRPPSNKSAALGGRAHKQWEKYLEGGQLDFEEANDVGNIAASIIHLLPKPGTSGMKVEGYFKFQSPETGIWYRGYKDLTLAPEPPLRVRPKVLDHKTTSSISSWAKTPEILRKDVQAIIYSYDELRKWPEAEAVDLQWTYAQTKGPRRGEAREVTLTRAHVWEEFSRIELGTRDIIRKLELRPDPLSLPPNRKHCREYGGCPFLDTKCVFPKEFAFSGIGDPKNRRSLPLMSLLPSSGVLDNLGTPAPAASPAAPKAGGLLGSMLGQALLPPAPVVEAPQALPAWADPAQTPVDPRTARAAQPVSDQPINPPESTLPPAQATGLMTDAGVPPVAPEAPKKRGRPAGSKNKGAASPGDPLPGQPPLPSNPPATAAMTAPPIPAENGPVDGYELFINCVPDGVVFERGETLIAKAHAEIRESMQVGDYRFIDFGKGAGILSARVAELAKECTFIVLDARSPEGMACRDALAAGALHVTRGF